jgi:integrase
MPSIHKDSQNRSPHWIAAFRGSDGKRKQKSTGTSNRADALRLAVEWERLAKDGRGKRLVAAQARKVISEITEQATGEPLHYKNASEYLQEWLRNNEGTTSKATFAKYQQVARDFLKSLGARADLHLNAIGAADVTSYRDKLMRKGLSAASVVNLLKVLSVAFDAAHREGIIQVNPVKAVKRPIDTDKGEREAFTMEQLQLLLGKAEGDWKGCILFGLHTGLRLKDITNLRWENVDLEARTYSVRIAKIKRPHNAGLHSDIEQWLRTRIKGVPHAFIFPDLAGRRGGGESGLSKQFRSLMEKAGIKGRLMRKAQGKDGRNMSSLSFHSLRHTCATIQAAHGVPEELRMAHIGHSTKAAHKIYTHREIAQLRQIADSVPSIFQS